jgi:hypothetical protein
VYKVITWEKQLSVIKCEQENFAYVRLMFSTTCKYNSSKHNELINKKKIHEIADKPSKEPSCYKNSPNFFYLKKRHHANRGQDLRNTKKSNPSMEKHVYDMSQTPMAFQRDSNLLPSRGLVRMWANWFSVGMKERETTSDSTRSRKKWCLMSMCLVWEWRTGFLEIFIELVLSQLIIMVS